MNTKCNSFLIRVGDGGRVAIEADAASAFGGARELLPLGSVASTAEVCQGHVGELHGSGCELVAGGDRVGFQGGVSVGELASTVGALEGRASATVARLDGVVGLGVAAVGGDVTGEDVARSESLNGGGVVGGSSGAAVPRGKRPS